MFEIYSYFNVETLWGVFNALVLILGSQSFLGSLAAVAAVGFIAAFLAYAFQPSKLDGWKWICTVVAVYTILFVPRTTVMIVDRTGSEAPRTVANVPYSLAMLGGLTSGIGDALTGIFETAFRALPGDAGLPAELGYQQNGMMFGARVVQTSARATFMDPRLSTDVVNFITNCTVYDLQDGAISLTDWRTSTDLWPRLANTNPARYTQVSRPTGGVSVVTCPAAHTDINGRMSADILATMDRAAAILNPTAPDATRVTMFDSQLTQAYLRQRLVAASTSAAGILRQTALINAIQDAGTLGCQRSNDPACVLNAQARANSTAAMNSAWMNAAKVAEQALPMIRNAAEAVMYGAFPIIILMLLLTTSLKSLQYFGAYCTLLISIQLWPPLFAVVNYVASIAAGFDIAAAGATGTPGLSGMTTMTASSVLSASISNQAVVSTLVTAIPFLSYALCNRMVGASGAFTSGVTAISSTSSSEANALTKGNVNMGNVSLDQREASPKTSSPFTIRTESMNGDWVTQTRAGTQAVSALMNNVPFSVRTSSAAERAKVQEAGRAVESARVQSAESTRRWEASIDDTLSRAKRSVEGYRSQVASGARIDVGTTRGFERLARLLETSGQSDTFTDGTKTTRQYKTGIGGHNESSLQTSRPAGGSTGNSAGSRARIGNVMRMLGGLEASRTTAVDAHYADQSRLETQGSKGDSSTIREQFADLVTKDRSVADFIAGDSESSQRMVASLVQTRTIAQSDKAALNERMSYAERVANARRSVQEIAIDQARLPQGSAMHDRIQSLADHYWDSPAALASAVAGEIASYQGLPAAPVTRNTKLPWGEAEVRRDYAERSNSGTFEPFNSAVQHAADKSTVRKANLPGRTGSDGFTRDDLPREHLLPESVVDEQRRRSSGRHADIEQAATRATDDARAVVQPVVLPGGHRVTNQSTADRSAATVNANVANETQKAVDWANKNSQGVLESTKEAIRGIFKRKQPR